MPISIVGLGPGGPTLLTIGSLDILRAERRAVVLLAPPDLSAYLETNGVQIVRDLVDDPALFVRGGSDEIQRFVQRLQARQITGAFSIAILGNPLSDFPGIAQLLRAFDRVGLQATIVPAMPRSALSASIAMPLVALPPQSSHHSWDDLVEIMARLRMSCPWDREQTHRSLVPYLIEETYEVVEAIENGGDKETLCEELGDLLLQIVFHAQIAQETGAFTVADVVDALSNKMVRRHPHVFGDAIIEDVDAQWRNWERLKALEKTGRQRKSRLDGIPTHLGALQRGQRMQEKASRVGFDWPAAEDIVEKLAEEAGELVDARRSKDSNHVTEELGDVIFTLVNLARGLGIDAEAAMRQANERFYRRFTYMEERAAADGKTLADLSLDELERLWQRAKTQAA